MSRYICIHGHFYQPPRENPWLEEIELQDSAYPYHDWNEKISAECYAPNAVSRILDQERKIIDIVNNYIKISFNFGPTLLSWMQRHKPDNYRAIIEADKESQKIFSGHGSAIAQCYNHMIMPLANSRDKYTQVIWGIKDFEYRFNRKPEGMWLPEAAVDLESLDILAAEGIKFTILAPSQAKRVRKIGEENYQDVHSSMIDPKKPYLCKLPSGRTIVLFFYDGPISQNLAFGDLLGNGENFAQRLTGAFSEQQEAQLVHIATDGETYGHHHRFGDMALAYCLYYIEANNLAKITVYGEFLEKNPPLYEAEIFENSSWSCFHGVDRWKSHCGCNSGMHHGWNQNWRTPLRGAMDWLRDNLSFIYEEQASNYLSDPWLARNEYIEIILNRTADNLERFFSKHAITELSKGDKIKVIKLLEIQRNAMLMYTSCGWFFDEISGIETTQILQYASRAMQFARDISNMELENTYIKLLERAVSNISEFKDGAYIYETFIKPAVLDLVRVGAHYALSSLFENYPRTTNIYCYTAESQVYDRVEIGKQKFATGKVHIHSNITLEDSEVSFAVLHLGDHNLIGGVREYTGEELFSQMLSEMKDTFVKSDISQSLRLIEKHFTVHNYSLWHLFKDEQRKILNQILESGLKGSEMSLRQINEQHFPMMQVMKQMNVPLPKLLALTADLILNIDIQRTLENEEVDFFRFKRLVEEAQKRSFYVDKITLGFVASFRINAIMEKFSETPGNISLLETVESILSILNPLSLNLNLWKAQNIYFSVGKQLYNTMQERADSVENAKKWLKYYNRLGDYLKVRVA